MEIDTTKKRYQKSLDSVLSKEDVVMLNIWNNYIYFSEFLEREIPRGKLKRKLIEMVYKEHMIRA